MSRDHHFPTILGIIFLLAILAAGVYLSGIATSFTSKASKSCTPLNPRITNLTYNSFDFSFTTDNNSCSSTLSVDSRVFSDISNVSSIHYFRASGLKPATAYKFSLISGGTTFSPPEYSLSTAAKPPGDIPASNLAWGRVLNSDLKPVDSAIVFLNITGAQPLSALTNKDGKWNISFASSFNQEKTSWLSLSLPVDEEINVSSPDGKLTQISNRSDNNDPVPDIIVGQNYFSEAASPQASTSTLTSPTTPPSPVSLPLSITSPKEGETLATLTPDIFGQAPVAALLELSLDSQKYYLTVPQNGTWHWSPPEPLSAGVHNLKLNYQDQLLTRSFTLTAPSSSLAFTATPSATLAPTMTLPSPTTRIVSTPTFIPTQIPPTIVPTIRTAKISTTSTLIKSGNSFPTWFLGILSLLTFSVSFYYYRNEKI